MEEKEFILCFDPPVKKDTWPKLAEVLIEKNMVWANHKSVIDHDPFTYEGATKMSMLAYNKWYLFTEGDDQKVLSWDSNCDNFDPNDEILGKLPVLDGWGWLEKNSVDYDQTSRLFDSLNESKDDYAKIVNANMDELVANPKYLHGKAWHMVLNNNEEGERAQEWLFSKGFKWANGGNHIEKDRISLQSIWEDNIVNRTFTGSNFERKNFWGVEQSFTVVNRYRYYDKLYVFNFSDIERYLKNVLDTEKMFNDLYENQNLFSHPGNFVGYTLRFYGKTPDSKEKAEMSGYWVDYEVINEYYDEYTDKDVVVFYLRLSPKLAQDMGHTINNALKNKTETKPKSEIIDDLENGNLEIVHMPNYDNTSTMFDVLNESVAPSPRTGDYLLCHTSLVMDDGGDIEAVQGKIYQILNEYHDLIHIKNESGDLHGFDKKGKDTYTRWFTLIPKEDYDKVKDVNPWDDII